MKKTLIALAALAATGAFAQSSVTIYGTFDPSIASARTTYADGATVTKNSVMTNGQGTSQVTFKGVEDLGGGLKAMFLIENDFDAGRDSTTTTPSVGNWGSKGGELYTGLEGGFGSVKLGGANTPSLTAQGSRTPYGTKIGSGFGGVLGTGHVRESNSIVYATPNFSGFSAALGYAFGTPAVAAANNGTANPTAEVNAKTDLGLNYNAGPLNAGLSYYRQADVNNQTNLYANYTFGPATVYAGYHKENKLAPGVATAESRGANIAVKYAITPSFNLSANFARLDDQSAANADKKIAAIGAQYLLSKRTSAYARYVQETNDNVPAVATSITGVKTALVGIQHNF